MQYFQHKRKGQLLFSEFKKTQSGESHFRAPDHRNLLSGLKTFYFDSAIRKLSDTDSSAFTTVIHGDLWVNNFMIRDGTPDKIKFLDFGNVCVAHPAYDIVYFLYMNTDREFRKENLESILREYFEVFQSYLGACSEDVGFDIFREEFESMREAAMLVAMHVSFAANVANALVLNTPSFHAGHHVYPQSASDGHEFHLGHDQDLSTAKSHCRPKTTTAITQ
jgi:hypothetical protein